MRFISSQALTSCSGASTGNSPLRQHHHFQESEQGIYGFGEGCSAKTKVQWDVTRLSELDMRIPEMKKAFPRVREERVLGFWVEKYD